MTTTSSEGPNAADIAAKEIAARTGGEPDKGSPAPPSHKGPGRPPGAKNKKKSGTKKTAGPVEDPITPEEIAAYAFMGGTIWSLSAKLFNLEELNDEERERLGTAMAPVIRKYLPVLGDYAPEAALFTVVAGLVMEKRKKKPVEGEPDLTLVDGEGKDGDE